MAHEPHGPLTTTPVVSLIATGLFLVAAIVLISLDSTANRGDHIVLLLGVLVLGLQAGIGAMFAERSARHSQNLLTNGIMDKAREGARRAIKEEQGSSGAPWSAAELESLRAVVQQVFANTAALARIETEQPKGKDQ